MAQGRVSTGSGADASGLQAEGRAKARAPARAEGWSRWARWWRVVLTMEAYMVKPAKDSVVEFEAAQITMTALAG